MYDVWNNHINIVEEIYNKENYSIKVNNKTHDDICFIFFSSNDIWFPNTEEAFKRSFIEGDYYEWLNYSDIQANKVIYVRDIYKSWYVTGINKELNSVDAVIEFLKKQTSGMRVITVGSSAGGYMASLAAALLNAEYCICFSAQFDLTGKGAMGVNPFLRNYSQDANRSKYYNIVEIIKKSKVLMFYIMPAYCESDKEQMDKVAGVENVHILRIASHHHGVPLLKGNLSRLIQMDKESLLSLFDLHKEHIVGMINISIQLSGVIGTCICVKDEVIKLLRKYLRR